jgi:hypothetical protein
VLQPAGGDPVLMGPWGRRRLAAGGNGRQGVSELKPGGSAEFMDDTINDTRVVSVVSDSGFLPPGSEVVVTESRGSFIVVRKGENGMSPMVLMSCCCWAACPAGRRSAAAGAGDPGVLGGACLLGSIGIGFWINQWIGAGLLAAVLIASPFAATAAINLWPKRRSGNGSC